MPNSYTLDVDGTNLNYRVSGAGQPLLVIGIKPRDAEFLEPMIGALAGKFTVIPLELRGIDIIPDELRPEPTPERRADDVAALIDLFGAGPMNVFGTGAGAVAGLALIDRHPARVLKLVVHEPPLLRLVPDAISERGMINEVVDTLQQKGVQAAWELFLAHPELHANRPVVEGRSLEQELVASAPFLACSMPASTSYLPDISALARHDSPIIIGVGAESGGLPTFRAAISLAGLLGTPPFEFPGDTFGHLQHPVEFAAALARLIMGEL